jgi:hypothetical protein
MLWIVHKPSYWAATLKNTDLQGGFCAFACSILSLITPHFLGHKFSCDKRRKCVWKEAYGSPCDGTPCDGKIFFPSYSSKNGQFFFLCTVAYLAHRGLSVVVKFNDNHYRSISRRHISLSLRCDVKRLIFVAQTKFDKDSLKYVFMHLYCFAMKRNTEA